MVKTLCLAVPLGALALGACATDNSTPLKDLNTTFGATTMEIVARGQVSLELHVAGDGCPTLSDDLKATFNGHTMNVARGGSATDAFGCYPIAFFVDDSLTQDELAKSERAVSAGTGAISSQILIQDSSTTWQIAPTRLFGNNLENDVANSRIVWPDVDRIAEAIIYPAVDVKVQGDSMFYPPGTNVTYAQALAHPVPTVCTGPGLCTVDFQRTRSFSGPTKQD
ncbi:MAG TPA: hypothetical protein VFP84_01160 [Kofleriaceae bacterium]|nr:hypothetical protein [Kofleriaceae bacterium]